LTNYEKWKLQNEGYQRNATIRGRRTENIRDENAPVTSILMSRAVEVGSRVKSIAANRIEDKPLVVLQVNRRTLELT
jgi:hypothetical protein